MHSSATMVPSALQHRVRTMDQSIGMERPRSRQKLTPLDSQEGDGGLVSTMDSTDINIDWTISDFVINHRQSDAIKSPELITAGLKWHLALASGTQSERDHIAVYLRYKVEDDSMAAKSASLVRFHFTLTVGGPAAADRLTRKGTILTEVDGKVRSTFPCTACINFHPIDDFWANAEQYCDVNGDLKVSAAVIIEPVVPDSDFGSQSDVPVPVKRSFAVKPHKANTIPAGTTIAVRGEGQKTKKVWWLGQLVHDLATTQNKETLVEVRWWNKSGKKNLWTMDPKENVDSIITAAIHKDGSLIEMVQVGSSSSWKLANPSALDDLATTYES
eukprot:m.260143 g.260143  ORF g.260143 m.260143 type:complete len:330 (-) comp26645_c0_seq10:2376-3365(-)